MSGVILRASNEQISSLTPRLARKLPKDSRVKITFYLLISIEQTQEKDRKKLQKINNIGQEMNSLLFYFIFFFLIRPASTGTR